MENIFYQIFSTQRYDTVTRKAQAQLLYLLASVIFVVDLLLAFAIPTNGGLPLIASSLQSGNFTGLWITLAIAVVILITIGFVRQGRYEIGAWALNGIIFITLLVALRPGIDSDIDFMLVALVTVLSAVTLEERGLFMIGGASALVMLITYAQRLPSTTIPLSIPGMSAYGIFFATTFALVRFASVSRSAGRLAESEERFKLAEINSQITRQASERAKLDAAMDTALHLILENYSEIYHAQVFLIDDDGVQARLVASTGDTGQRLIDKGHSLAVGSLSVIGQTTFKGEPVIARSGEQNTVHRQNQLLPQTRLEAAFPLQVGGKIIGALDLQSREDLQLSDYDILSFQSLANSLSLSIDSIRQYEASIARMEENQRLTEQTRNAMREVERLNQRLIGRAWSEYLSGKGSRLGLNIDLDTNEVEPASDWTKTLVNVIQSGAISQDGAVIAIPLRVQGVIVGAMEFEMDESNELTPADMELVQEVSERFGLAAENTRLVEESQRVAQREALINEISSRLQSANNVEATLAEAARSLSETLQANRVMIRLGIPSEQTKANEHSNGATE